MYFLKRKTKTSLRIKLNILSGIFLVAIFAGSASILLYHSQSGLKKNLTNQAESFAQLSVKPIIQDYEMYFSSGYLKFKASIDKIISLNPDIKRIQIIDAQGNILVDSKYFVNGQVWQGYRQPKEKISQRIQGLLKTAKPIYLYNPKDKSQIAEILYPYFDSWGVHPYTVGYFISYQRMEKAINQIEKEIIIFTLVSLLISLFLMDRGVDKLVVLPLAKFQKGVKRIFQGELDYKIDLKTHDEIEELAKEFNRMVDKLRESKKKLEESRAVLAIKVKARTRELKEQAEGLEEKVKLRTRELQQRVTELEKFHKSVVGREITMAELKGKIIKLENQLAKIKNSK